MDAPQLPLTTPLSFPSHWPIIYKRLANLPPVEPDPSCHAPRQFPLTDELDSTDAPSFSQSRKSTIALCLEYFSTCKLDELFQAHPNWLTDLLYNHPMNTLSFFKSVANRSLWSRILQFPGALMTFIQFFQQFDFWNPKYVSPRKPTELVHGVNPISFFNDVILGSYTNCETEIVQQIVQLVKSDDNNRRGSSFQSESGPYDQNQTQSFNPHHSSSKLSTPNTITTNPQSISHPSNILQFNDFKPEFYWFRHLLSNYPQSDLGLDSSKFKFAQMVSQLSSSSSSYPDDKKSISINNQNIECEKTNNVKKQKQNTQSCPQSLFPSPLDPLFIVSMNSISNSYEEVEFYKSLEHLTETEKILKVQTRPNSIQFPNLSKIPHPIFTTNPNAMCDIKIVATKDYQCYFILMFVFGNLFSRFLPDLLSSPQTDLDNQGNDQTINNSTTTITPTVQTISQQQLHQQQKQKTALILFSLLKTASTPSVMITEPGMLSSTRTILESQFALFKSILSLRIVYLQPSILPLIQYQSLSIYPNFHEQFSGNLFVPYLLLQLCHSILPPNAFTQLRYQVVTHLMTSSRSDFVILPHSASSTSSSTTTSSSLSFQQQQHLPPTSSTSPNHYNIIADLFLPLSLCKSDTIPRQPPHQLFQFFHSSISNLLNYLYHLATNYQLPQFLQCVFLFPIQSTSIPTPIPPSPFFLDSFFLPSYPSRFTPRSLTQLLVQFETFIQFSYYQYQHGQPTLYQSLFSQIIHHHHHNSSTSPTNLRNFVNLSILSPFLSCISVLYSNQNYKSGLEKIYSLLPQHLLLCTHAGFLNPVYSNSNSIHIRAQHHQQTPQQQQTHQNENPEAETQNNINTFLHPIRSFLYAWLQHKTGLTTIFNSTSTDCDNNLGKLYFFMLSWNFLDLRYFPQSNFSWEPVLYYDIISILDAWMRSATVPSSTKPDEMILSFENGHLRDKNDKNEEKQPNSMLEPQQHPLQQQSSSATTTSTTSSILQNPLTQSRLDSLNLSGLVVDQSTGSFLYANIKEPPIPNWSSWVEEPKSSPNSTNPTELDSTNVKQSSLSSSLLVRILFEREQRKFSKSYSSSSSLRSNNMRYSHQYPQYIHNNGLQFFNSIDSINNFTLTQLFDMQITKTQNSASIHTNDFKPSQTTVLSRHYSRITHSFPHSIHSATQESPEMYDLQGYLDALISSIIPPDFSNPTLPEKFRALPPDFYEKMQLRAKEHYTFDLIFKQRYAFPNHFQFLNNLDPNYLEYEQQFKDLVTFSIDWKPEWTTLCPTLGQFLSYMKPMKYVHSIPSQHPVPFRFQNEDHNAVECELVQSPENCQLLNSEPICLLEREYKAFLQQQQLLEYNQASNVMKKVLLQAEVDGLFDHIDDSSCDNSEHKTNRCIIKSYSFPPLPTLTKTSTSNSTFQNREPVFYLELLLVASLGIQPELGCRHYHDYHIQSTSSSSSHKANNNLKNSKLPHPSRLPFSFHKNTPLSIIELDQNVGNVESQQSQLELQKNWINAEKKVKIENYFKTHPYQQKMMINIASIPPMHGFEDGRNRFVLKQFPFFVANDLFTHHITTSLLDTRLIMFDFI